MRYYELTKEEKKILKTFDEGRFRSVLTPSRKRTLVAVAKNTSNKAKNINIRLSERDLYKLKVVASRKGIPYQTLVASLIHQYSEQE